MIIFREEATSAVFHVGTILWSNLEMLIFVEGTKLENPGKKLWGHSLLTISFQKLSSFSAKKMTKLLFGRTLTFRIDLFTYWTVKLCKKI